MSNRVMRAPNHIIGGYVFTGSFSAFLDINILSDWRYLVIVFFGSLLPDIDHSKSLIGRMFLPLSKVIHRTYGHRTLTHSLLFFGIVVTVCGALQSSFFPSIPLSQLIGFSMMSHLIFDMMTLQGIPLLYPFRKNPCVIPANPAYRLRTNSIAQETSVFAFFIVASVFLQPLIANGFWSTYNQTFRSYKHLVSEYEKMTPDDGVLLCSFKVKSMSQFRTHSGVVLDATSSTLLLYDSTSISAISGSEVFHELQFRRVRGSLRSEERTVRDATAEDIENLTHLVDFTLYSTDRVGAMIDDELMNSVSGGIQAEYPRSIQMLEMPKSNYLRYKRIICDIEP